MAPKVTLSPGRVGAPSCPPDTAPGQGTGPGVRRDRSSLCTAEKHQLCAHTVPTATPTSPCAQRDRGGGK